MFSLFVNSRARLLLQSATVFGKPLIASAAQSDTGQSDSERLTQRWLLLALIVLLLGIGAAYVFLRRRQNTNRK